MSETPACTRHSPTVKCQARADAQTRGAFWYSYEARGWLWSGSKDILDPWTACPWCGGQLPTLMDAVMRLLGHTRNVDNWEGEDGG